MNEIDFIDEYNAIFERSLVFSIISQSIGLVSLENLLDKRKYNKKDIFEFGMRLVMDGRASELINKVLTNIISLEENIEKKVLKNIQKDAVLSIQQGISQEELVLLLNSYVSIEFDKAREKYNEINEFISKGLSNEYIKKQKNYMEIHREISEKVVNNYYESKNDSLS
jgi:flagellar motor component MotA